MDRKGYSRLLALLLALVLALPVSAQTTNEVVIVLDPGHGGMDSGTVHTYDGVKIRESDLNLQIACYCRDYLQEHYENVRVSRTRTFS